MIFCPNVSRGALIWLIALLSIYSLMETVYAIGTIGAQETECMELNGKQIEFAKGQLLIVFRKAANADSIQSYFLEQYPSQCFSIDKLNVGLLKNLDSNDLIECAADLAERQDVVSVSLNKVGLSHGEVNDSFYVAGYQWALKNLLGTPMISSQIPD